MKAFRILSALLQYPEQELVDALPELRDVLARQNAAWNERLAGLFAHLAGTPLITLQQEYVATFDRNPAHSLHLFEHIHGESRDRGQAMVDLLAEYRKHGLDMVGNDLPDYVPLFLEFLAQLDEAHALPLLADAVHVLAHVGRKLRSDGSVYAPVFELLEQASPVAAETLSEPPVRDMDEALETFGPGADGAEPLLNTSTGQQTIKFYPRPSPAVAGAEFESMGAGPSGRTSTVESMGAAPSGRTSTVESMGAGPSGRTSTVEKMGAGPSGRASTL
ncbi:nitrate reductase molybdenum cofactor assembly chaperone [Duganella sp. FT92W]|uniref:Nitrate reductase molybdenum cofactor assembly chaperone n=1 Tax=Pseudoduganella rivuli TaxID=2666085 RepID=A0A7X2ILB6_9BURK|nr:nitrate reductase molybdenum cofactor assembly chaperone [Pseudoduganella rivuli]MRV71833.1 nitrate reductase molybdenum cofactor assembly chaperone [Pseudoduganella rivuli]